MMHVALEAPLVRKHSRDDRLAVDRRPLGAHTVRLMHTSRIPVLLFTAVVGLLASMSATPAVA
jgi:hypothetical protein